MDTDAIIRTQLASLLAWEDAHVGFDAAVDGIPSALRGRVPRGLPHSAWQLVEHLRLAQHDILDFCVNPTYHELAWPDDYWPSPAAPPPSDAEWDESIRRFKADRERLQALAIDPSVDLTARSPTAPARRTSASCCSSPTTLHITSGNWCSCAGRWESGRRQPHAVSKPRLAAAAS
jgi:hypothetical protein